MSQYLRTTLNNKGYVNIYSAINSYEIEYIKQNASIMILLRTPFIRKDLVYGSSSIRHTHTHPLPQTYTHKYSYAHEHYSTF